MSGLNNSINSIEGRCFCVSQLLVVVQGVLLPLSGRLPRNVLPSNRQDYVSHHVVLYWGHLANSGDNYLVAGFAKIFWVVCMEVAALRHPDGHLVQVMVAGNANLHGQSLKDLP